MGMYPTEASAIALLYQTCWCGEGGVFPTPRSSVEFRPSSTSSMSMAGDSTLLSQIWTNACYQHIVVPDLRRHVGIGGVFFQYLGQVQNCISRLFRPFPFRGERTCIVTHYIFLSMVMCTPVPSSRCQYFVYMTILL